MCIWERLREPLARLLIPALFLQLALISAFYFLAFPGPGPFPRSVLVVYVVLNGVLTALWRALLEPLFPQPRRRALVVGTGQAASLIVQAIRRHPWTGVEVVGCVGDAMSAAQVLCPDARGETIFDVIGVIDRFFFAFERRNCYDGSENFFPICTA